MCGIVGWTGQNGTEHDLDLMLAMITHRGPDALGTYIDDNIALGNARLSIIGVADGHQPMFSDDGNVVVVLNGEIFNYVEIRDELKKLGHHFKTHSDTEVLLNSYLHFGLSFVSKLNGQFAIALWDKRIKKLFLFRDRVGIRPLFFFHNNEQLIFASELKAIGIHKHVPRRFNEKALDQIFTFWTSVGHHTMLKDIHELPPAHYLEFSNGQISVEKYWSWPFPSLQTPQNISFENAQTEFVDQLQKAVDLCLRADVEVGAYLSGGIDSSAIVALTHKTHGDKLQTFSVAFKEESYDERAFQKIVSDLFKTKHHIFDCDYSDIEQHFRDVIWHTETPIFRTAPTPLFLLSQHVRDAKIKVVLTGEGSDEILLGYDLFRETKIRQFWARQPNSERRPKLLTQLYAYLPQFKDPRYAPLAIRSFKNDLQTRSPFYSHLIRFNNSIANKVFFSDDIKSSLQGYDVFHDLQTILPPEYFLVDAIDQAQYLEMITLLRGYLLSSQGDRMSMGHSVEGRYPFLDHTFIEYASRLPRKFKLNSLKDKYILRQSMKTFLPESITSRPKIAYQAPEIRPFITSDKKLSPLFTELLNENSLKKSGIFNSTVTNQLIKKITETDLQRLGTRDNMAFVQILSTQIFCELFIQTDLRAMAEEKLKKLSISYPVRINKTNT